MFLMRDFSASLGAVDDPWYTGKFGEVYSQILEGCQGLLTRSSEKIGKPDNRRQRAFLFDLDGTLLNTLEDIADAMNTALHTFGLPPWETEQFRWLVGNGAVWLISRPEELLSIAEK